MKIDLERCRKAIENLFVGGVPYKGERFKVIEDAIAAIQSDGSQALRTEYYGTKDYAQWSDQRCDCEYGMGPRHGSIVFRVGRTDPSKGVVLGADEIYLLECVRDFGAYTDKEDTDHYGKPKQKNLCAVLNEFDNVNRRASLLALALTSAEVETHC